MKMLRFIMLLLAVWLLTHAPIIAQDFNNLDLDGRWAYGPARVITRSGTNLYIGNGGYLQIMNLVVPNAPAEVNKVLLPEPLYGVDVSGTYAFVADGEAGLISVNLGTFSIADTYNTGGSAMDVVVSGNYAYVADGSGGLVVLDISDPTNMTFVDSFQTVSQAMGIAFRNNHVFVTYYDGNIRAFDVSTPATVTQKDVIGTSGIAEDIVIDGNMAYVAAGGAGLVVINIADEANLVEAWRVNTGGYAYGVAYFNFIVYVADGTNTLRVINTTTQSETASVDTPGDSREVAIHYTGGNLYAYVADSYSGVQVFNVTSASNPVDGTDFDIGGHTVDVFVLGDYAYLADTYKGLRIIDITNPAVPVHSGSFNPQGEEYGVFVSGNFAYMAAGTRGLQVINVTDKANPALAGFFDTGDVARAVVVSGDYAYVADGDDGLAIINVAIPANPTLVTYLDTSGEAVDVDVVGNYAYVAYDDDEGINGGIRVINITDPANPQVAGTELTGGNVYGIDVFGDYAFMAIGTQGIMSLLISDPSDPTVMNTLATGGRAVDVAVSGDYAFVADGTNGFQVVDVRNPANMPAPIGYYDTGDVAQGVFSTSPEVYGADGDDGFYIFDNIVAHLVEFNPVNPTGRSRPVVIENAVINGVNLQIGDEIAVYWGNTCVGGGTWRGSQLSFPVWLAVPEIPLVGADTTDKMIFVVWDKSEDERLGAYPTFAEGDGKFSRYLTKVNPLKAQLLTNFLDPGDAPNNPDDVPDPLMPTSYLQKVIVYSATFDGAALSVGDEIAVYDGALCVGAVSYQGAFPITVPVWVTETMADATVITGATEGNTMSFKIWDNSSGTECDATPTYLEGTVGVFDGVDVKVNLGGLSAQNQQITITANKLNMISFNVRPALQADRMIDVMLDDVNNLVLVQNDAGNAWLPGVGGSPWEVDFSNGFEVYHSDAADQIADNTAPALQPDQIEQDYQANFAHLIGYPYQNAYAVTGVFADITGLVTIIWDDDGQFWIPSYSVNTIGNMQPGNGYRICLNATRNDWYYPAAGGLTKRLPSAGSGKQVLEVPKHFSFEKTGRVYAILVTGSDEALKAGDEIGVFAGNLCVGAGVFEGEYPVVIAAWGAIDLNDMKAPGFTMGEAIQARVWKAVENKEYDAKVSSRNESDGTFGSGSMAELHLGEMAGSGVLPEKFDLGRNYPNPFNPETTIPFQLSEESAVQLTIYNTMGQKIRTLVNETKQAGWHTVRWDGLNDSGIQVGSGIYIVKLQAGSYSNIQKMTLIR